MKPQALGTIFASAIGDGFGYPTEFLSFEEILQKWPPHGPQEPLGTPIKVTDDTQMALAVGRAIVKSGDKILQPGNFADHLIQEFISWLNDPENNRAPGMTCLSACERLEQGMPWPQATANNSKGCGANMRVMPVALLVAKGYSLTEIAQLSQLQSAITHAHPTALAASEITAITIALLLQGHQPDALLERLISHAQTQQDQYHAAFLLDTWQRPGVNSPEQFIKRGWEEVLYALDRVQGSLPNYQDGNDPCRFTGEGWIAEEAFATALLCFLHSPEDAVSVLRRSVASSGDSDSIACLAGAFVGAYLGLDALPDEWVKRIESERDLRELAEYFF